MHATIVECSSLMLKAYLFVTVSKYVKSVPDKLTLKLKDGGAVDPDSGLSESAHVLTVGRARC